MHLVFDQQPATYIGRKRDGNDGFLLLSLLLVLLTEKSAFHKFKQQRTKQIGKLSF